MDNIQFNGWNLLQRNDLTKWVDSFSTLIRNPRWTDIEAQLGDKAISTIFVFREGYIPCWECGLYNCKVYVPLATTDMEEFLRKLHGIPLIENTKVAGMYYNKTKECMRFWLAGDPVDITPVKEAIMKELNHGVILKSMYDTSWVSAKTKQPFTQYTKLPFERLGLDRTDPELFEVTIMVPEYTISFVTGRRLRSYIAARDHNTIPLVAAEMRTTPFMLKFLVDCRRRCEIYQKYEMPEVILLITAEWQRKIVKLTQAKIVNAVITKNDAGKTKVIRAGLKKLYGIRKSIKFLDFCHIACSNRRG